MKFTYKRKLSLWFIAIFVLFTVGVVVFERSRERRFKTEALEARLDSYADIADRALSAGGNLDSLLRLLPAELRLTLIDRRGNVLYDNVISNTDHIENHASRPEIEQALRDGSGSSVRLSSSNNSEYLYYAKRYTSHFIRAALPYNIRLQQFIKADNAFLYYIILLLGVMLLFVNYIAGRFGKSINRLRDFASNPDNTMLFPDDELGEIGAKIAENYRQSKEDKKNIALQREKLMQHIHTLEEGVCFFSADRRVEFYNGLFIQYLNTIMDEPGEPSALLSDPRFAITETSTETRIDSHGHNFMIRINRFEDGSFEVAINDITRQEKTRQLKQEMTGNIAHELRTPVTTIRGYLETLLETPPDAEKQRIFLTKAYNQTLTLSELLHDMGMITRIEEAPASFDLEPVEISALLESVKTDLGMQLDKRGISMEWNVGKNVTVNGNANLLYSVFRNLTENVIRYAGAGIRIFVTKYNEDADFYYFSYSDTGVGIPDEHLGRLFERFYRINEGRTRDTGGSGLGLSIVKHAIQLHYGTITAKNRAGGGLEFLFKLPK